MRGASDRVGHRAQEGIGNEHSGAAGPRRFALSAFRGDGMRRRRRTPILPPPERVRGVVHILEERCKGCELCIDYCPMDVLELSTAFNAMGYHYPVVKSDDCIDCQACRDICPEFAIFSTAAPRSLVTSEVAEVAEAAAGVG